jgi:hypothetical protein
MICEFFIVQLFRSRGGKRSPSRGSTRPTYLHGDQSGLRVLDQKDHQERNDVVPVLITVAGYPVVEERVTPNDYDSDANKRQGRPKLGCFSHAVKA